jgi:CMP-N-acetylneuraminic acid synthetase
MPNLLAIVPMRHNSERVKGKNYRLFGGKPLYRHIVETLLACEAVGQVVIDTDSPAIMDDARATYGDRVTLYTRPPHLRDGSTPMNDVLLNTTAHFNAEFYLQTHSTNPLLRPSTLADALARFFAVYPQYDSLFAVTRLQVRLWDALARPVNHNPNILLRTQDLPPIYAENSNFYVFTRETLLRRHNRVGDRPMMVEVPALEAWDIDEEADFAVAETIYHTHYTPKGE